jgi:hypothetical protein
MKTIFTTIIIFLMFLSTVLAQNYSIKIEQVGYGATNNDVVFIISNTGESLVRGITVLIDEKKYETISGTLGPKRAFQEKLYLEPGKHFIEVKTLEGAYDSINITTVLEKPKLVEPEKTESFFEKNKVVISSVIFVIVLAVFVWLLVRRPRMKL